ncbi:DEAD/DEAH box helicase [Stratiformator vulcanicus]|uniref:ATP-dependent helicase HepA n=1 Tax=Stratiformator vulcanicus TaxID=2527980 RepID=A0A517R2I6_9PLAN|nr:DEAD/DEAH box helicase [Stratiformator vulcanicus]QDT38071.1 ATP-dependent helicase HepA [Stratiformator vulcanicus]
MTLAELLEKQFRADLRFRGEAYVKTERVAVRRVKPDQVEITVRDGEDHFVQLDRTGGKLKQHCTCPQFQKLGLCKHVWAAIVMVDAEKLLTADPRAGHVPPFAAEPEEPAYFLPEEDEDEDYSSIPASALMREGAGETSTGTVVRKPKLKGWERKFVGLIEEFERPGGSRGSDSREREIFYEIDEEATRKEQLLVLQISQRQRRVNGQWGKLKALRMRPGEMNQLEHEDDRTILSYLFGGTPDRSDWAAQRTESTAATSKFHVPHELSVRLLPMICRTGRLRFAGASEKGPTLSWDDNQPWELTVKVERSADEDEWLLGGELVRQDAIRSISDVRVLIPGGLVIDDDKIAMLRDFEAFAWAKLLNSDEKVTVPDGEEVALVDRLLDMPVLPRLDLPEELHLKEERVKPRRQLTVRSPGGPGPRTDRLLAAVEFVYDGAVISGTSDRWAIVQRENGRCLVRDDEVESTAWNEVLDAGFRRRLDHGEQDANVEILSRELGSAVRKLVEINWNVRAEGKPVAKPSELSFRVASGIDWFELHADVDFDGRTAQFPEILAALARGDSTVRLDDGSLGIIPEAWAAQFGLLAGIGVAHEDHVRFSANQVALLDTLLSRQDSVAYDDTFQSLSDTFRNFDGIKAVTEPSGFGGELRPYQRDGLSWLTFLEQFQLGGCLADDMGLGKTVQLLAHLEARRRTKEKSKEKLPRPSIVVVPKSLLFNWLQEAERFTPDMQTLEYTGSDRHDLVEEFAATDLVVTTYGTLRRDIMRLKDFDFDYVVLDEAQTIKNSNSQIAKASRLLKSRHRLALSGTPIENHLGDLWSIFEFLNPGMLGRSRLFKSNTADEADAKSRELLARALKPFILRRTKSQVARDLPEKSEQVLTCDMGPEQQTIYNDLREHYRASLLGRVKKDGLSKSRMHVLEALLRLRQAACHPSLLGEGDPSQESAKIDLLMPKLEELIDEGHKALIFSQFTSMLSVVRHHLDERGFKYEYLDGQTRDREARVKRFQDDPTTPLFLISLKAGGLGLNLTAADYVFLLDPWWNPAVESQAIDRAHRLGQQRRVFAYRLIVRGTVEEKIAALQNQKRELAEALLEEKRGGLGDLTLDDIDLLLS